MFPQSTWRQTRQLLSQPHQLVDEGARSPAEGQIHALWGTEQIRDARKVTSVNLSKQQGRSAAGHDTAMDFGDLQIGADRHIDLDDLPLATQDIEKGAQVVHVVARRVTRLVGRTEPKLGRR